MEILKITDSKLKIMLSAEDMKKYKLSRDSVDYNDAKTRRSFSEILSYVKSTHGFNTERDKVLIQFYPSKDGGSELFVTKLGLLSPASEKAIARSGRVTMLEAKRTLYLFDELPSLLRASALLGNGGAYKSSDVYLSDGGEYYLELCERGNDGNIGNATAKILEFARAVPPSSFPYISEHCKRLTRGNALEIFGEL